MPLVSNAFTRQRSNRRDGQLRNEKLAINSRRSSATSAGEKFDVFYVPQATPTPNHSMPTTWFGLRRFSKHSI